jgi:hypothetical protein
VASRVFEHKLDLIGGLVATWTMYLDVLDEPIEDRASLAVLW